MRGRLPWRSRLFAALFLGSSAALALDPSVPLRIERNPLAGATVAERVTPEGTNQTSARLPAQPHVTWQTRLAPPILGEPVVDARGRVLVAHANDRVTALDATGRVLWSVRLGADVASGPVPLAAGRSLIVTRDARAVRLSPTGAVEERESLPSGEVEKPVLASPTRDGGALVAAGASLLCTGAPGTLGFHAGFADPLRGVFEWQSRAVAVGRAGTVFVRPTVGDPQKLASFGQPVRAIALSGDRVYGLGKREFLSIDLTTRERRVLFSDPAFELKDFAALGGGKWRLVGARALLVDLDASGHELGRFMLAGGDASAEVSSILTDRSGRTWLTLPGAALLDVTLQGEAKSLPGTGCPDPLRPTPVADGLAIAGCRSGLLRGLSDKAR